MTSGVPRRLHGGNRHEVFADAAAASPVYEGYPVISTHGDLDLGTGFGPVSSSHGWLSIGVDHTGNTLLDATVIRSSCLHPSAA